MSNAVEKSTAADSVKTDGEKTDSAISVEDLKAQLARLEQSNQRLIRESQEHKLKAQKVLEEKESFEQERLKKEGDLEGYAKRIAEENAKLKGELNNVRTKVLKANIKTKVSKYAGEVHDLEDLLNQTQFKDVLQRGINQDELDIDDESAKEYVNLVLKNKPWLKKAVNGLGVDTTKPGQSSATSLTGQTSKKLNEMSVQELMELAKQNALRA